MRNLLASVFLPAAAAVCQQDGSATIGQLSRAAGQELERSVRELQELRDQIAGERLPIAKELSASEERLVQQRKTADDTARKADAGNVDVAEIRREMKTRQDELGYIGNMLDEYARSFESKINVSELQYCGAVLDAAKQAPENTTLTVDERLNRQIAFASTSLQRLGEVTFGLRFPGEGIDDKGTVVEGKFAIVGPVALFRGGSGVAGVTGVVVPQAGSTRPLIHPLDDELQTAIGPLVQDGEGTLPLDPSRGGALKALVARTNLYHIFEKGGPIMWPLLVASILALATVLERMLFLANERRKRSPATRERLFEAVEKGDVAGAVAVGAKSKDFVVRTLSYALDHRGRSLTNAVLLAQARELKRFRRGIPILDTVITLAPLLGLLGTVTGMMGSFSLIGGELSSPGAITGGIAEALIATAFGLGIAITALLPFNFLNARLDEASAEIESAGKRLELLLHPGSEPAAPVAKGA
jgi:biopolymer transport protein ExbB